MRPCFRPAAHRPFLPLLLVLQDVDASTDGPHDDILTVHFLGWTDAWNEEVLRGEAAAGAHLARFMSLSEPWELALRPGDFVELNRAHPAVVEALAAVASVSSTSPAPALATPALHSGHGHAAASRGLWVVGCVVAMDHAYHPPLMTVAFAVPSAVDTAAPPASGQQLGAVPALATLPVISAAKDACVRLGTHITRDKALYMFKQEIFERAGIALPPAPRSPAFVESEAGLASSRVAALPLPPPPSRF